VKFVQVPEEPTEEMLIACRDALRQFIKAMTPEEKLARGWMPGRNPNNPVHGYRFGRREKDIIRFKAMLAARPRAE
jgi:hypothetical protein